MAMVVRPWMNERDYAAGCVSTAERSQELEVQLRRLEAEEALLRENAKPDARMRLEEIAERKPALRAGLIVLEERYAKALQEAKAELANELRPRYVKRLKPLVEAAVNLLAAAKAELGFRVPLLQQDVPFSGTLQGLPLGAAGPDGQLIIWLRRVDRHYPEIGVRKLAEKRGVEL